jgi:hypothetical protein
MRKNLLALLALILFAALFSSFKKPVHKPGMGPSDCYNSVVVYAAGSGLTLTHVTITVGSQVDEYGVNLTNGQNQIFTSPYYTQGATINVSVSCAGGGEQQQCGVLKFQILINAPLMDRM